MLNIVVPMAGRGSRFAEAGYDLPKPLLPVRGQPMISFVIDNLRPSQPHRFTFICQAEHIERYRVDKTIREKSSDAEVLTIDHVTQGAACTVLLAERFIDNADALMIANCDQYVDVAIDDYLAAMDQGGHDGFIMTMTANDPKWSFVRLDADRKITQVVEKRVVSNEATVGIYNFRKGASFVRAAKAMIDADERVNNEFYVAPAYNRLLAEGQSIGFMNIGSERAGMYGLGIPEDLEYFNALP